MAIYGYCRISTQKQSLDRQVRNIRKEFPEAIIVEETYTGTSLERPKFEKLVKKLRAGDTLVFDSVSRMARNAEDGIKQYFELFDKEIKLVFLKEPHVNTDTYKKAIQQNIDVTGNEIADIYIEATNRVMKILATEQIRLAFEQSQKEVDDMRERTKEGLLTASLNGTPLGRSKGDKLITKKSVEAKKIIVKHSKDFSGSLSDKEVMKLCGISKDTFYKYKRDLKYPKSDVASD
mgnify:FL=1